MALWYADVVPVVAQYGDALAGKVIVNISDPFNSAADGLAIPDGTSIAQEVVKAAPASASVVKALQGPGLASRPNCWRRGGYGVGSRRVPQTGHHPIALPSSASITEMSPWCSVHDWRARWVRIVSVMNCARSTGLVP